MKKANFNNKLIIIFVIAIFIIIVFSSNIYGMSFVSSTGINCTYPDEIIEYMKENYREEWEDDNIKWICWFDGVSIYYLQGLSCEDSNIFYNYNTSVIGINKPVYIEHMVDFNTSFSLKSIRLNQHVYYSNWSTTRLGVPVTKGIVYFKNTDVYTDNTYTDFFFQTVKYKIPAITEVEQIPMTVITMMKLMIPIGLIIFGILFVILLVKSVIWRMI